MGSSVIRSVIVPITGDATGPTEPVCVILDSTDASAIYVSPTAVLDSCLEEPQNVKALIDRPSVKFTGHHKQ